MGPERAGDGSNYVTEAQGSPRMAPTGPIAFSRQPGESNGNPTRYINKATGGATDEWMDPAVDRLRQQGRTEGLFKGPDGQVRRIQLGQSLRGPTGRDEMLEANQNRVAELRQNTDPGTPRTALTPTPEGTPDQPAWAPTMGVQEGGWARRIQELSRDIGSQQSYARALEPVDLANKPQIHNQRWDGVNPEVAHVAFAQEGLDTPLSPGTYEALANGAVQGFGWNERMQGRRMAGLGYIDTESLGPLQNAWGPTAAGSPGTTPQLWRMP